VRYLILLAEGTFDVNSVFAGIVVLRSRCCWTAWLESCKNVS